MAGWAKKAARGAPDLEKLALWREGVILGRLGRPRAARTALLAALQGFEKGGQPLEAARVAVDLVEMLIRNGLRGEAQKTAQQSTPRFEALGGDGQALAPWLDLLALMLRGSWGPCLEHAARFRAALADGGPRPR